MEMVDVDDLKAACARYEKQAADEALKARRSDREVKVLTHKIDLAKQVTQIVHRDRRPCLKIRVPIHAHVISRNATGN
eukprot:SAG31_NODE_40_length_31360_cov_6.751575_5_plen_78_part_00